MKWLAAIVVALVLYLPLTLFTVKIMTPELGVSVSTLVNLAIGLGIGWVCALVWQAVDLWERGY